MPQGHSSLGVIYFGRILAPALVRAASFPRPRVLQRAKGACSADHYQKESIDKAVTSLSLPPSPHFEIVAHVVVLRPPCSSSAKCAYDEPSKPRCRRRAAARRIVHYEIRARRRRVGPSVARKDQKTKEERPFYVEGKCPKAIIGEAEGEREDQLPFCSPNEREVEQSRASYEEERTSHYCSSNLRSIDFFVSVCEVGWDRGVDPILQVMGGECVCVF